MDVFHTSRQTSTAEETPIGGTTGTMGTVPSGEWTTNSLFLYLRVHKVGLPLVRLFTMGDLPRDVVTTTEGNTLGHRRGRVVSTTKDSLWNMGFIGGS